jgi:hypothetical protein
MSRYAAMFDRLAVRREGAFGAFLMLGDPDLGTSARLLDEVVSAGADMIEVGIPYSDPVADGPVIQAAAQRALAAGTRVGDCLDLVAALRARHSGIPIGILTYANIVVARSGFMRDAADAGRRAVMVAKVSHVRGGNTPCSAIQKLTTRYGCMLLCGWLPPATWSADGLICAVGPPLAAYIFWPRIVGALPHTAPVATTDVPGSAVALTLCTCAGNSVWMSVTFSEPLISPM